ncbi:MAG: hypothetical protein NVSMB9_07480 [Isosphaeraceae bacterium]
MPDPKRSQLRRLIERPDARPRVGRAVASLLGVGVFTIGAMGALLIWHLVRRGRLIRESLTPPRVVPFREFEPGPDRDALT